MKSTAVWALAALNMLLLAHLVLPRLFAPAPAHAAGGGRVDLIMLPGEVIGGNSAVVYLIDTRNRKLGAVSLDNDNKRIMGLKPLEMERAFADAPERGGKKRK